MARTPSTIPELPTANTVGANDYFIIEKVGASGNTTSKVNANTAISSGINGPYANDTVANTNNVAVGDLYYDDNGFVKIRLV